MAHIFNGNGGNNVLIGTEEDEIFYAGAGNDKVYAAGGDDLIYGQQGNDELYGQQGNDTIYDLLGTNMIRAGAGDDVIRTNTEFGLLIGGGGYDRVILTGTTGIDINLRSTGIEWLRSGDGDDMIDGAGKATSLSVWGLGGDDTITGGSVKDYLFGGNGQDTLFGGNGDDELSGENGDDELQGNSGEDILRGGLGTNILNGGDGSDTASYADSANGVHVSLILSGQEQDTGAGVDYLVSIENLVGSLYADTLIGDDGDNVLNGNAGEDMLIGGLGDDVYVVDDINDQVVEWAAEGNDLVIATTSYQLGDYVENLQLEGSANLAGVGNDLNNNMTGNAGANYMLGFDGDDTLFGADGDDTLVAHIGNDTLYGGNGADRLLGGLGDDRLVGGNANDQLRGNEGSDTLLGGNGSDFVEGGQGKDILMGGADQDTFSFLFDSFGGDTMGTADRIMDFSQAEMDVIRLSEVDANTNTEAHDSFNFIGSDDFGGTAGELRFETMDGNTYVQGDQTGDGVADFMIRLDGEMTLTASDFVL